MGQFDPNAIGGAPIADYVQTPIILTSQQIQVLPGTKRIEALVVGGGGGGGSGGTAGGGAFGGAQIYDIPLTGFALDLVIGSGGAVSTRGGTSTVSSAGTLYAAVGGGGGGAAQGGVGIYGGSGGGSGGGGSGALVHHHFHKEGYSGQRWTLRPKTQHHRALYTSVTPPPCLLRLEWLHQSLGIYL